MVKGKLSRYDQTTASKPTMNTGRSLKNQIRSIERLIKTGRLKGDVLSNKRKLLNNLKVDLANQDRAKKLDIKHKRIAIRYHQVKFLERVKLVRKLKTALKNDEQVLYQDLGNALRYVLFFPKGENYISILKDKSELRDGVLQKRNKFLDMAVARANEANFDLEDFLRKQKRGNKRQIDSSNTKVDDNEEKDDFFLD